MCRRDEIRAKIMARVVVDPVTGCHIWTGPTSGEGRGGGYPRMCLDGQTVAVHKVSWTNEHGFIPGKKQLDHRCRNRLCVNPDPEHLELVTHKQNQKRRAKASKEGTHGDHHQEAKRPRARKARARRRNTGTGTQARTKARAQTRTEVVALS